MGNQKTESPQANCGEWAAGGWSQLFGLGGEPSQEAQKRGVLAARGPVERLPPAHRVTSTGEQACSSAVPYESRFRSGQQTGRPGQYCKGGAGVGLSLLSLSHTGSPESGVGWGCSESGQCATHGGWSLSKSHSVTGTSHPHLSGPCFPLELS